MFELGVALVAEQKNMPMLQIIDKHASRRKHPLNAERVRLLARLRSNGTTGTINASSLKRASGSNAAWTTAWAT